MSTPTNPLVITLQETDTAERDAGSIWFREKQLVEQHAREASAGILQALKDGRGASHAATILDKLDRAALRELGHDAIVLVVQL